MSQSRKHSALEVTLSTGTKFVSSFLLGLILYDLPRYSDMSAPGNIMEMTVWFTINSLIISYFIRRVSNYLQFKGPR